MLWGRAGCARQVEEAMMKVSIRFLWLVSIALSLAGCTIETPPEATPAETQPALTPTQTALPAATFTPIPSFTPTLIPTLTLAPTSTLRPTNVPRAILMVTLQVDNGNPKYTFHPKQSSELENNRMGTMSMLDVFTNVDVYWMRDKHTDHGLKWARLSKDWYDWEEVQDSGEFSTFEVSKFQDWAINELNKNGVQVMYTLLYWDETLKVGDKYPRYVREEEIQRYLEYVRFIVSHFKGRVQYYEILNEPELGSPQQHVEVASYINLVRRVAPAIREVDPQARIVVGATSDLLIDWHRKYLFNILRSDIMPLVDGISWHPLKGASPEYDEVRAYYYGYPTLVREIQETAVTNGFAGEYFAEEMNWRTSINPRWNERLLYPAEVSAKYYARSIVMHLGMDVWAGFGAEKWQTIQPLVKIIKHLSTVLAGVKPAALPVEVTSEAQPIASYGFRRSDGELLLAIWVDNAAVVSYPGAATDLVLPGLAGQRAIATDILNSFEQELVTGVEGGDLVIRGLLLPDYPLFIRLTEAAFP